MIVATEIKEKDEDLEDKDIFILMAQIGNSEKLKEWHQKSKSISDMDINESLALAALNGQLTCLKYLIEQCGEQIPKDYKGKALAQTASRGDMPCVKYLMKKCGAQMSNEIKGQTLELATEYGHMVSVTYLIEKYNTQTPNNSKGVALQKAAFNGDIECLKYLTQQCGEQIPKDYKDLAIDAASTKHHMKCAEYLIKQYDKQISPRYKGTALRYAVLMNESMPYVEYLIKNYNADISCDDKGIALMWAIWDDNRPCVEYLIEQCGDQIPNFYTDKALIWAALTSEGVTYLQHISERDKDGAQISDESKNWARAFLDSNSSDVKLIECAIQERDAKILNNYKGDALKLADSNRREWHVQYLIEKYSAQFSTEFKRDALICLALKGDTDCLEHLIKKFGTEILNASNGIVFEFALFNGDAKCVKYLIEKYSAQILDKSKLDALLLLAVKGSQAVKGNHKEVVKILIQIPGIVISETVLKEAIHCTDHDIIHLLALEKENPTNGNRYKTEDGKDWRFGMTEPLLRTLEQERYQQLKDDLSYYIYSII